MPVTLLTGEIGSIVGEYKEHAIGLGAAIATPTDGSLFNIVGLVLAPGDWDVVANGVFNHPTATAVSQRMIAISTVSLSQPQDGHEAQNPGAISGNRVVSLFAAKRISLAVTTTIYLVGKTVFTGGGCNCWGFIGATRAK
jgi:hypothetical protein